MEKVICIFVGKAKDWQPEQWQKKESIPEPPKHHEIDSHE